MKKVIIPVIAFFVLSIGFIVFSISQSYVKVQYGKDAMFHMMTLDDGATVTATCDGVSTNVIGRNTQRIYSTLTVSELKRIFKKPEWDEKSAIYLNFSDGAKYIIAHDPSENDGVFIFYTYKNKTLRFKVSGYNSYNWLKRAISPEGIFNKNELLD